MKIILLIFVVSTLCFTQSYSQSLNTKTPASVGSKDYLKQLNNQVFLSYTYIRNLGNFGNTYKYGSGIYLNYGKYFPNSWLAVARVGFINQELRAGVDTGYTDFKVYPVHIGGRFYVYKNMFMPYFSFMNGLNLITNSNHFSPQSNETTVGGEDQFLVRYAYQVGFGFDVKFTRQFGINLNINYNNSFYDDGDLYTENPTPSAMMTGFEYSAGISYDIGK
ncbi:MAG: hypothetical protein IPL53_11320 [Ignavibacteria bacterium]|nr:hypothetical protein [Ignavibacteria bacterium]